MVNKKDFTFGQVFIYSSLIIGIFLVIWPLMNILSWSLTPTKNVHMLNGLDIFPKGLDFDVFKLMLSNPRVLISFSNSIFITTVGLVLNMTLALTRLSWALSRPS